MGCGAQSIDALGVDSRRRPLLRRRELERAFDAELCQELPIVAGDDEASRPDQERLLESAQSDEVEAESGLVEDQELRRGRLGKKRR